MKKIFILIIFIFSVSCIQATNELVSINVDKSSIVDNQLVSEFNITKINLILNYKNGLKKVIKVTTNMLKEEDLLKLDTGGKHTIYIFYFDCVTEFEITLIEDGTIETDYEFLFIENNLLRFKYKNNSKFLVTFDKTFQEVYYDNNQSLTLNYVKANSRNTFIDIYLFEGSYLIGYGLVMCSEFSFEILTSKIYEEVNNKYQKVQKEKVDNILYNLKVSYSVKEIYSIDIDGLNITPLKDPFGKIFILDDWIYLKKNSSDIVKYNLITKETSSLHENYSLFDMDELTYYDGYIYFITYLSFDIEDLYTSISFARKLYRIDIKNNQTNCICKGIGRYSIEENILIYNYQNTFHTLDLNNYTTPRVHNIFIDNINDSFFIINNYIYYLILINDKYYLKYTDFNYNDEKIIDEGDIKLVYKDDLFIYYIKNNLYLYKANKDEKVLVLEKESTTHLVVDDILYIQSIDECLIYNLSNQNKEVLSVKPFDYIVCDLYIRKENKEIIIDFYYNELKLTKTVSEVIIYYDLIYFITTD